jgi:energy-converting hydrogenase Eha subunit E
MSCHIILYCVILYHIVGALGAAAASAYSEILVGDYIILYYITSCYIILYCVILFHIVGALGAAATSAYSEILVGDCVFLRYI